MVSPSTAMRVVERAYVSIPTSLPIAGVYPAIGSMRSGEGIVGMLVPRDYDSHVIPAIDFRLTLGEALVPVEHPRILSHDETDRTQVGRHLLLRPRAHLRLADQLENHPRDKASE